MAAAEGMRFRAMSTMNFDKKEALKTWELLRSAIGEIFNSNEGHLSYEELYRSAYNMVLYKHGDMLYQGIAKEISLHLQNLAQELLVENDEGFLSALVSKWEFFVLRISMVKDVLMYLDRTYVPSRNLNTVFEVGLQIFLKEIARQPEIKRRYLTLVFDTINRERHGERVNHEVLRKLLVMLVELGINSREIYVADFEDGFLKLTEEFYSTLASHNLKNYDVNEYLRRVDNRLQEEKDRAKTYLDFSSEKKLLGLVERELIEKHHKELVSSKTGCNFMFKNSKLEDLKLMFELFNKVPITLVEVKNEFITFITQDGEALISKATDDKQAVVLISTLLAHRENYESFVINSFYSVDLFKKALKDSFEKIVNLNKRLPHFLSLFVDDLLKHHSSLTSLESSAGSNSSNSNNKSLDDTLNKVLVVLKHLNDKDVFEECHKKLLAKRLLSKTKEYLSPFGREMSNEELLISKLKAECGPQFTTKLENMLRDLKLSGDEKEKFSEYLAGVLSKSEMKVLNAEDFEVTVLTTGSWPYSAANEEGQESETVGALLPEVLRNKYLNSFENFYNSKHEGRKLMWALNLGTAEIKATLGNKQYTLIVSTYQMLILNFFSEVEQSENKTSLSFEEIKRNLNIEEFELKRHLISLAAPKYRILNKEPKGKVIENSDLFSINDSFSSPHSKVRIPLISSRSTANQNILNVNNKAAASSNIEEENEISPQLADDRKFVIEAALMRIMKARKTMKYNILVAEVVKAVSIKFKPSVSDVKDRIESLVEREFFDGDDNDPNLFHYQG